MSTKEKGQFDNRRNEVAAADIDMFTKPKTFGSDINSDDTAVGARQDAVRSRISGIFSPVTDAAAGRGIAIRVIAVGAAILVAVGAAVVVVAIALPAHNGASPRHINATRGVEVLPIDLSSGTQPSGSGEQPAQHAGTRKKVRLKTSRPVSLPASGTTVRPHENPPTTPARSSASSRDRTVNPVVPSATSVSTTAYDNTGISNDNTASAGAFDGGNESYSAQALAANGFVSGRTVTVSGISFNWPDVNVPDNIVCSGQTVSVGGSGSVLGFLGASNNGTASGTGSIVYTDGTTQKFTLGFADWYSASPLAGTTIAIATPYFDRRPDASKGGHTVNVYYTSIHLIAGKTVRDVVLPDVTSDGEAKAVTALHVFAMTIAS